MLLYTRSIQWNPHMGDGYMEFLKGRDVKVTDPFWLRYVHLVRDIVIPYQWDVLNDRVEGVAKSGAMQNFRIAAGLEEGEFYGFVFQDSDVAKWLETVAHVLALFPDAKLEKLADEVIALIGRAQQPDGYLNTRFTIKDQEKRWTNERDWHELYVAGHMMEAAAAYFAATGKREFLDIMCGNANHIDSVFGPEPAKKRGYPGHQVAEMGLVQLFHATGEAKYLRLARFFINERGQRPAYFDAEAEARGDSPQRVWFKEKTAEYSQTHVPVREQDVATGHAVRAMYLYSGMADVAALDKDESLMHACHALWNNVTRRQMFITAGLGQQDYWEGFSFDYDLPNDTAYNETCASVGLVFWAQRMSKLALRAEFADVAELALYNGVLSGISLDGKRYFYVNPLAVWPDAAEKRHDMKHVETERLGWFGCACCPPNASRLLASVGNYIYSADEARLAVHQYIASNTRISVAGCDILVVQDGNYIRDGQVSIKVETAAPAQFELLLRMPGWAKSSRISINGEPAEAPCLDGYLSLSRVWRSGDLVELAFPTEVRRMQANPLVREDAGKVAVARGPLVYCIEECDNGPVLSDIELEHDPQFVVVHDPELLGGIPTVCGKARRSAADWGDQLYREARFDTIPVEIRAVPYYGWNNRGKGEMLVWMRQS